MKKMILTGTVLLALCAACDSDSAGPQVEIPIVVEGWIEDEDKPVVIVTKAADIQNGSGSIDELVQRWCRITVSDGEESEVLVMRINDNYVPPVIYTSSRLRGKVGHTYTLKVEVDDRVLTAVTTIPPVARLDSLRVKRVEGSDSMYMLRAYGNVCPDNGHYYKLFTRTNGEKRYYSSFLGLFKDDEYDPRAGWNAARGIHDTSTQGHFTPNYRINDTVQVKLCTLDADAYRFWESYEKAVSLQSNMFFISTTACEGNIQGGKGYWAGYGTSFATVIISNQ